MNIYFDINVLLMTVGIILMSPAIHSIGGILWIIYGPISKKDQEKFDAKMEELFKKHLRGKNHDTY